MAKGPIKRKGIAKPTKRKLPRKTGGMVVIDQQPLRRAAGAECQHAMARLVEARGAWNRFEREDKPGFARWRAREFGALLSEAREIEAQIHEKEALVREVEMEMRRGFFTPQSAYQRVMFRRANPSAADANFEEHDPGIERGPRLSEFEQEALFQDWVRKFIGTNPDIMDDAAYTSTFEAFKFHMFGNKRTAPPPNESTRADPRRVRPAPEEEEEKPTSDARVKELYRLLVRRLHPDLRADGDVAVSTLWHEVQEAYAMGDIERMEILLALSDIESNNLGDQTSLFQMRAVFAELKRALRALQRSLSQARHHEAWNFVRRGASKTLRQQVQQELEADLETRKIRLIFLSDTIAGWAAPPRFFSQRPLPQRQSRFAVG
jgi:hypothetical protein